MKQNYIKIIIWAMIWGSLAFLCACSDEDKVEGGAPEILYLVETMHIDLNKAERPAVISVVNSEVGLKSVNTYILKTGGSEQKFGEEIMSFKNPNSYSISASITYSEDMTGFRVVAVDNNGQQSVKDLALDIVPLRNPPAVVFNNDPSLAKITYREGDPMPALAFNVSSEENLNYVVISEVINRVETIIQVAGEDTIKFTGQKTVDVNMEKDLLYQFRPGITAVKVSVGAGPADNMKLKVATLYIDFIEIPAPVITFDNNEETIEITENQPLKLTGKIKAEGKANTVQYFTRDDQGNDTEIAGSPVTLNPSVEDYNFTVNIPAIQAGVKAIVVKVEDDLNKSTENIKKLNVIELVPAPTINLITTAEDINGVDKTAQFSLKGSVTSLGVITGVNVIVTDNQGVESTYPVAITDPKNVNLSSLNITPAVDMAKIRVEAVDENNKKTISNELDMYVGYSYYRLLVSSSGFDNYNDVNLHPFLSAANATSYGYEDAKANSGSVDIGFSSWGGNTQIGVVNINVTTTTAANKFNHPTGKPSGWSEKTAVKTRSVTEINRTNFDKSTIDDITALPAPTATATIYLTTGSYESPNNMAVLYETMISGVSKRVIFCYDELRYPLNTKPAHSGTEFYIKVKIEK